MLFRSVSVAVTVIEYVPAVVELDAVTTPELLIVTPDTAEPSEVFATDQVIDPVPPVLVNALLEAAVPNVVEIFEPAETVIAEFTTTFVEVEFEFV